MSQGERRLSGSGKKFRTFGRYQSTANEVDLVPYKNDRPRGHVIAPP